MKNKNKRGAALVFTIVILSISVIVALSIAATSVISRKGASGTERASRSFQGADAASDAFDKYFETTPRFVNPVNSRFGGNTEAGRCESDGTITSDNGSQIILQNLSGTQINCNDSSTPIAAIRRTKVIATDGVNKRVIENVPPCAGFVPDTDPALIGKWNMDNANDRINCASRNPDANGACIKDESNTVDNSSDMQLKAVKWDGSAVAAADLPGIMDVGDKDGDGIEDSDEDWRTALYINKNVIIDHENNGSKAKAKPALGENHIFNFAQIPPKPSYSVPNGTVSFWFYSENDNPADWGFTPYSRDTTMCLNDFVGNGNDRNGDGMFNDEDTDNDGVLDPGEDTNGNGVIDPDGLPVGGYDSDASGVCNGTDGYWPFSGFPSYNNSRYKYLCDCGHMSFMWNAQWWSPYEDRFGTRFQNDTNGSHYRLRSGSFDEDESDEIIDSWHLAAITFNSGGAWLYYDDDLVGTMNAGSNPPMPGGTPDANDNTFEGLRGNFQWTYLGMFAGNMQRGQSTGPSYNVLNKFLSDGVTLNPNYDTNGTRYLAKEFADGFDGGSGKLWFYPFQGGIRRMRLFNRDFSECEMRRIWYETL